MALHFLGQLAIHIIIKIVTDPCNFAMLAVALGNYVWPLSVQWIVTIGESTQATYVQVYNVPHGQVGCQDPII